MSTASLRAITTTGALRGVDFAALLGSDSSGAFKPDGRVNANLVRTAEGLGVAREEVLLVAIGLESDILPAREIGVEGVWVDRYREGRGEVPEEMVEGVRVFASLEALVRGLSG